MFLNRFFLIFLKCYRRIISPFLPRVCRFEPSCSQYAIICFQTHHFFKAFYLTVRRILRCHPFHSGGYDPVP